MDIRNAAILQSSKGTASKVPANPMKGQVHWFQSGGQSVVGHLVSIGPSRGVAATFSCANGCCGDSFVALSVDPPDGSILDMTVDESITVLVTEQKLTCTGGSSFRDVSTDSMTSISSSDTSVAVIHAGVKNQIDLVGAGTATITISRPETTFNSVPGDCLPPFPTFDVDPNAGTCPPDCLESPPTVVTSTFTVRVKPRIDRISPPRSLLGNPVDIVIDGNGFGTNPTVQVAGGGITVTVSSATTKRIDARFNIAVSAPAGSHGVTVSAQGQTSTANTFFVQIPSEFEAVSVTPTDLGCPTGFSGFGAAVVYRVLDQQGIEILMAGMTPLERFSTNGQFNDPNFLPFATQATTDPFGIFVDMPIGTCSDAPPAANLCFDVVQFFKIVVPTSSGELVFSIPTITTRRDCVQGIRVQVATGTKVNTVSLGTVN